MELKEKMLLGANICGLKRRGFHFKSESKCHLSVAFIHINLCILFERIHADVNMSELVNMSLKGWLEEMLLSFDTIL